MYSKQSIAQVKNIDVLSYLSSEYNFSFRKEGRYYRCTDEAHSSLIIEDDKKRWHWNSRNLSGGDIFDWLELVEGMSFIDTMKKFAGTEDYTTANIVEENDYNHKNNNNAYFDENEIPKKTQGKYSNLFAYLTKSRHISENVVNTLIRDKRIYQDIRKNVVFTNRDEQGSIKFWCLRGTNTEKKFTRIAPGTKNEYYGFVLDTNPESDTLYIFEAPIDLLSHCTIADIKSKNDGSWKSQNRIALLGVNDFALECYLPKHPKIKTLKFCLDNDEAGKTATQKYMKKYYEKGYRTESITYKSPGKDINEILCNYSEKRKPKAKDPPEISRGL